MMRACASMVQTKAVCAVSALGRRTGRPGIVVCRRLNSNAVFIRVVPRSFLRCCCSIRLRTILIFAALYLREFIGAKSGCIASQVTMKTVVEVSLTRRLCNLRSFGICQL